MPALSPHNLARTAVGRWAVRQGKQLLPVVRVLRLGVVWLKAVVTQETSNFRAGRALPVDSRCQRGVRPARRLWASFQGAKAPDRPCTPLYLYVITRTMKLCAAVSQVICTTDGRLTATWAWSGSIVGAGAARPATSVQVNKGLHHLYHSRHILAMHQNALLRSTHD